MSPPLLGDAQGHYRIHIVGNSGVGKSTVGAQLAEILGVPYISLDALFWKPGWEESSMDEFRQKVETALTAAQNGWVVDGNYINKLGSLLEENETDIIWLDPPLALYLPRLIFRTVRRLLRTGPPCSEGCDERLSQVLFSQESIIWWCLTQHRPARRRETANMARIGLGVGRDVENRKMRRLGGWGRELRAWLADVDRLVKDN
ncbi:AAA domain-containing protein [Mycena belliarum]|uniref:AAA domain-containing protein n=1 Tax=Mycena belliarum TaxID=1033014 RepID=A0AAD6TQZ1_9AGAR|nr:AAA domain-containing protein [Mycena belliae]